MENLSEAPKQNLFQVSKKRRHQKRRKKPETDNIINIFIYVTSGVKDVQIVSFMLLFLRFPVFPKTSNSHFSFLNETNLSLFVSYQFIWMRKKVVWRVWELLTMPFFENILMFFESFHLNLSGRFYRRIDKFCKEGGCT